MDSDTKLGGATVLLRAVLTPFGSEVGAVHEGQVPTRQGSIPIPIPTSIRFRFNDQADRQLVLVLLLVLYCASSCKTYRFAVRTFLPSQRSSKAHRE